MLALISSARNYTQRRTFRTRAQQSCSMGNGTPLRRSLIVSDSQCSFGDGQDALRMSLAAPGSPPAHDKALLGRDASAQHHADDKQCSPGSGSPECHHGSAGELEAQLHTVLLRYNECLSAKLC